jgi:ATP-dependent Clp protease ATP-binding subunit ClpC
MPNPFNKIFNKKGDNDDKTAAQDTKPVENDSVDEQAPTDQPINRSTDQSAETNKADKTTEELKSPETPETEESKTGLEGTIDSKKRAGIDVLTRLTQRSNKAMMAAVGKARELNIQYIDTEHVLWGLLTDSGIYQLISELKATPPEIQKDLESLFKKGEYKENPQFSDKVKRALELSLSASRSLGYEFISPEHILLGLVQEGEGAAASILAKYGLTIEVVNKQVTGKDEDAGKMEGKTPQTALSQFTIDLTQLAKDGKLDPVVARSTEIERVMHVLSRRTKNNPVLIGEAGVGKTAIVEGLAQRIADGNVPEALKNKRILSVDLMSIVAGASHRGEFEERLKNLIREVKAAGGEITLFIDEIHNMVGTGGGGGDAMNAANILKPLLARGELQTIGATTITEYRKYMEKDRALERRFQPILVEEPTPEQALEMLTALRKKYEDFHKVTIPDDALKAAVSLSHRYIGDRQLPDKAVDLIDEASSSIRLPAISLPEEIRSLEERIRILEEEKQEAQRQADDVRVSSVERKLEKYNKELKEKQKIYEVKKAQTTTEVTPEVIQDIVSRWTNIPLSRLTESESKKLLNLEDLLHERIIDQRHAVDAVAEAIRRGRAGLKSSKRPIGSFIFMGPTGVGKTELAKAVAQILFGSEEKMVRLDMTEYMEKHEVAKLIGAPPGYVGYEEGGQLTEAVRRQPYSVVLLDEVEKAHADVFNILLQILDDGRLTDNKGRTIDFKNTILIATSNIGTNLIQKEMVTGGAIKFSSKTISTLTFSPTGRAVLTLEGRMWEKDKDGKSWTTLKLQDYFKGQEVEGADLLELKQKFPTEGFDAHAISPSGEELVVVGGRLWRRRSTTAKAWETLSLIDYFKDNEVTNAQADRAQQQLPTAKIGTIAVSPSETQVVTYEGRYWMRNGLQSTKWETGTLKDYLKGSIIKNSKLKAQNSKLKEKQEDLSANKENEILTTGINPQKASSVADNDKRGPAEPDPDLQKKVKELMSQKNQSNPVNQQSQPSQQVSDSVDQESSDSDLPKPGTADITDKPNDRTSENKLPTDSWDVHYFTPEGKEIIIKNQRFFRRDKFDSKEWETGELTELFEVVNVENANPSDLSEQLPIGQETEREKKAKEEEEEERFAKLKDKLLDELRKFFRPELLNRFDDTLVFKPLSPDDVLKIVDLLFNSVEKLLDEQNIGIEITASAKEELAIEGYDPIFGARPLRRTIQKMVENPISSMIIKGELKSGDIVNIDFDGKDFIFTAKVHPSKAERTSEAEKTQMQPRNKSQSDLNGAQQIETDKTDKETEVKEGSEVKEEGEVSKVNEVSERSERSEKIEDKEGETGNAEPPKETETPKGEDVVAQLAEPKEKPTPPSSPPAPPATDGSTQPQKQPPVQTPWG